MSSITFGPGDLGTADDDALPAYLRPGNIGHEALHAISDSVYGDYDPELLQDEIVKMRELVEETLGSPRHKHDIKRGKGGIMDIDFITHFLQLGHGRKHPELRTMSTRTAITGLSELKYIDADTAGHLLMAYNYLKKAEICMRLIDLKPSSTIPTDPKQNAVLSGAWGTPMGRPGNSWRNSWISGKRSGKRLPGLSDSG